MPEPRETHTAIDARRNARGGASERAEIDLYHLIEAVTIADDAPTNPSTLANRITDAVLAAGWEHPDDEVLVEGSWFARPDLPVILGNFMRRCDEYGREAKALAATIRRVRDLCDERSDDVPYTGWLTVHRLRAALAASDPATDTGGEAT